MAMFNTGQRREVAKWIKIANDISHYIESIHNLDFNDHFVNALDLRYHASTYGEQLQYKVNKFTLKTAKDRKTIEKQLKNLSDAHSELFKCVQNNEDILPCAYILCPFCMEKGSPENHRPQIPRPFTPPLDIHPDNLKYMPKSHPHYDVKNWIKISIGSSDFKRKLKKYTPNPNHVHKIYLKKKALMFAKKITKDLIELRFEIAYDLHKMNERMTILYNAMNFLTENEAEDIDVNKVKIIMKKFDELK
jgi:hypothetical protein